ncbi:hypothetical protein RHSIM_Rhsim01G0048400 [Rhododendron simsii]|uniref:Uncharacterized protein n=1 Tax=Rhododendron simsii TaxID=118357 RepID=A0A834HK32_RHOSS|nr:hypothetical protein RHSIM_Rhsim01G0048400 [Rhododendron simsii]
MAPEKLTDNGSQLCSGDENEDSGHPIRVSGCVDLGSLRLEPENVVRVVPGRILTVRFFPSTDMKLVAVGNELIDKNYDVYSSCYDGFLRLMDVEKEMFVLLYSSNDAILSISQRPNDVKSLYFCGTQGIVNMWDERAGKALSPWVLHEKRINTIDFSSANTNIMATSSTDGTACIWGLRFVDAVKPNFLKTVSHKSSVQSAYFSPSGSCLATTGSDDKVGLLSGANFEDTSMMHYQNSTGRGIAAIRAIWGWDDSYLFVGSVKREVDVISTAKRTSIRTLRSPHISAILCRFDAHPYEIGMLAGGINGGHVYMWSTC